MKIALVAPLFERVPPKAYGGTERVVSYLTEELVRQGHDVTLFATGDSVTKARLISPLNASLGEDFRAPAWHAYQTMQMDMVAEMAPSFDIIHFHNDYLGYPLARHQHMPHLATLHGRLDMPELVPLYKRFCDTPLVSISNNQRTPLPWVNWSATVYHGLPPQLYSLQEKASDYFVFIGRVSPEKRLDRAIEIAASCGYPLYVGAKIDPADEGYFKSEIKPLLKRPGVHFVGEVSERDKRELLTNARALLFPIDWPEPFGLVMIEAFACGTPVIAYRHGSIPEIIEHGVTGFIVDDQEAAIAAARNIESIDRRACRQAFDNRFTVSHMAHNYLHAYRSVICDHLPAARSPAIRLGTE